VGEAPDDITAADAALIEDAVARFARHHLAAFHDQPLRPVTDEDLQRIVGVAVDAGLLPGDGSDGFLWNPATGSAGRVQGAHLLAVLAEQHAGIAFHLHRLALGARATGSTVPTICWLPGTHRLADPVLVRLLVTGTDARAAAELLPQPGAPLDACVGDAWAQWLVPAVDARTGSLAWHRYPRGVLALSSAPLHGLAGVRRFRATLPAGGAPRLDGADACALLAELLMLDALGLMAIALGGVRDARARAVAQAALRRQGGKRIDGHDAVQLLLATQQVAVDVIASLLATTAAAEPVATSLSRAFALRLVAHEQAVQAVNAAMQVFGGSGYMQDMGLERCVRDANQLRLAGATPDDLSLFIARAGMSP
jgi:hypothetical protein